MSFSFKHRGDTAGQVRELAADQMRSAIELAEAGKDFGKTVHDLRRRCKKIRGLIRLVQPHFKEFSSENDALRTAANSLSAMRDAAVMIETFDSLMKSPWAGALSWDRKHILRQELTLHLNRIAADQDRTALLDAFASSIKSALNRIENWSLDGDGFGLLDAGLRNTYGTMRTDMEKAAKTNDPVHFHEWRKRVKYHGFHVGLLKPTAPHLLAGRKQNLGKLGNLLGEHHNIAVLSDALTTMAGPLEPILLQGLAAEQRALVEQALPLGRELAVEKPAVLSARFRKFWKLLPKEI